MTTLSVNVNKVATLRNTRTIGIPSVVHIARLALEAGAGGITVHPRPDRRHILPEDVADLARMIKKMPRAEFNIEGNPFHDYMDYARQYRPTQCTLVPDEPDAFTSNQGWDLARDGERIRPIIAELRSLGCRVSLFMDPDPEGVERAAEVGADRVELYTEPYASAFATGEFHEVLGKFERAAGRAASLGLRVNAGHDLNRANLGPFLDAVSNVVEVSIGHALIADALEFGIAGTVRKYRAITRRSRSERIVPRPPVR